VVLGGYAPVDDQMRDSSFVFVQLIKLPELDHIAPKHQVFVWYLKSVVEYAT
jgi:hypothetical protein